MDLCLSNQCAHWMASRDRRDLAPEDQRPALDLLGDISAQDFTLRRLEKRDFPYRIRCLDGGIWICFIPCVSIGKVFGKTAA